MKKVVIIGGGISGLSAGIFSLKQGFDTTIIEKNAMTGGQCMGWNRKAYHIDGCMHWLVGTQENTKINDLWKEVGALDQVDIYHPETFLTFEHEGQTISVYRDLDKLETHWKDIAQLDHDTIDTFIKDIKKLHTFDIPVDKPMDLMTLKEKIKLMLSMKDAGYIMHTYGKIDNHTYAKQYKHKGLKALFEHFVPKGYQASSIFFALAMFTKEQASLPMGGSYALSKRMQDKFIQLGGHLITHTSVERLNIVDQKVTYAQLDHQKTIRADYFIGALDAHHFYHDLLKNKYPDKAFENRFNDNKRYPLASQIQISLAIKADLSSLPRTLSIEIEDTPIADSIIKRINLTHFAYEKDFAPIGETVVTISINQFKANVDYWFNLRKNKEKYNAYKQKIGTQIISQIIRRFPELNQKVECIDIATPYTYHRYCNAYQGAFMAFLPSLKGKSMAHKGYIKGIKNAYFSGQWAQPPGGLPIALITGKDTIMRLCRDLKQPFKN